MLHDILYMLVYIYTVQKSCIDWRKEIGHALLL